MGLGKLIIIMIAVSVSWSLSFYFGLHYIEEEFSEFGRSVISFVSLPVSKFNGNYFLYST